MSKRVVLLAGKSLAGKTTSLDNLSKDNPSRVLYLNCEGQDPPLMSAFTFKTITDPMQVPATITACNGHADYDYIVIDSLSRLMEMFETQYVLGSSNTMKGWSDYAVFFKDIMLKLIPESDKTFVLTTHVADTYNESEMVTETKAVIKGSIAKIGVESFFNPVIAVKKMPLNKLEPYLTENNKMLTITEDDEIVGYKHVYQTRLTKETVNDRLRSPVGLFHRDETYIDADINLVIERMNSRMR